MPSLTASALQDALRVCVCVCVRVCVCVCVMVKVEQESCFRARDGGLWAPSRSDFRGFSGPDARFKPGLPGSDRASGPENPGRFGWPTVHPAPKPRARADGRVRLPAGPVRGRPVPCWRVCSAHERFRGRTAVRSPGPEITRLGRAVSAPDGRVRLPAGPAVSGDAQLEARRKRSRFARLFARGSRGFSIAVRAAFLSPGRVRFPAGPVCARFDSG